MVFDRLVCIMRLEWNMARNDIANRWEVSTFISLSDYLTIPEERWQCDAYLIDVQTHALVDIINFYQ